MTATTRTARRRTSATAKSEAPAAAAMPSADPLAPFSPAVRAWFESAFEAPTPAQVGGWASISTGRHTLIHAPTGSGKTLAAFLWCLDRLVRAPSPPQTREAPGSVRVLYVSPLKALTYDVERNLRAPLHGIALAVGAAGRAGAPDHDRRANRRYAPGGAPGARPAAAGHPRHDAREPVPDAHERRPRGAAWRRGRDHRRGPRDRGHEARRPPGRVPRAPRAAAPRRRAAAPADRSLGHAAAAGDDRPVPRRDRARPRGRDRRRGQPEGARAPGRRPRRGHGPARRGPPARPAARRPRRLRRHAVEHLARDPPPRPGADQAHRSTIVFTNSRRLAERMAQRLNELAGEELVLAHHGSIAREQRLRIEEDLKAGRIPALVATSSLELGIDMGAVDLVVLVESPTSVASGLQRVGRAGHQVGEPSKGVLFPKFRGDLLESAVVVKRMHDGAIETTVMPAIRSTSWPSRSSRWPSWTRGPSTDLLETVTRAAPFETLSREALEAVLGMLAGAYPSDEFAELKARVSWDRVTDIVEGRRDARVVAVTSGGTIPDRGLFGVFLAGEPGSPGRRVGELDEEMVYELRAGMHGDVVVLGASSWRVLDITPDRVIVEPAPGMPGKLPFWKGDAVGRPVELGRAIGEFLREAEAELARGEKGARSLTGRLREGHDLDELAAATWLRTSTKSARSPARCRPTGGSWSSVSATSSATGRLVDLTPFGGPSACASDARDREPDAGAARHRGADDLVGRRHRHPAARGRGRRRPAAARGDRGGPVPGADAVDPDTRHPDPRRAAAGDGGQPARRQHRRLPRPRPVQPARGVRGGRLHPPADQGAVERPPVLRVRHQRPSSSRRTRTPSPRCTARC